MILKTSPSEVHTLKQHPELLNLLPDLKVSELESLEESLKAEGCRDPIIVWNETIVDGHNRYQICHQHNIPFSLFEMDFETLDHAKLWVLRNQLSRRNLDPAQRLKAVEGQKPFLKELAKRRQVEGASKAGQASPNNKVPQDLAEPSENGKEDKEAGEVNQQIAELANLSREQVRKYERVMEEGSEEVKARMQSGKRSKDNPDGMSITAAYETLPKQIRASRPTTGKPESTEKGETESDSREVAHIEAVYNVSYEVEYTDGTVNVLVRKDLLEHGYEPCSHCKGFGLTSKGKE